MVGGEALYRRENKNCIRCAVRIERIFRTRRGTCPPCLEMVLLDWECGAKRLSDDSRKKELTVKNTELALKNSELDASLTFLRLQFDNQPDAEVVGEDLLILVQGRAQEPLHTHKFILASRSPVFCKMFDASIVEQETGILRIDDATLPVMRAVIGFCYTAKIEFTDEVPSEEVLEVAHKYGIDLLIKLCEEYLVATINKRNLPMRLQLARKFETKALLTTTIEYFKTNFDDVVSAVLEEFDQLASV